MGDYFPLCKLKSSPEKGQDDNDENYDNNDDDDNFSVTKPQGVP